MNTYSNQGRLLVSLPKLLRLRNVLRAARVHPDARVWHCSQRVDCFVRRPNLRTARLILLFAATSVGATNAYAADSASTIPTAGSDIKAGDIIFFRSDAPIFRKVFPAPSPVDTVSATDPKKTDNVTVLCAPTKSRFNVETVVAATTTPATATPNAVKSEDANTDPSKSASPATVTSADGTKVSTPANGQIIRGSFTSEYKLFHFKALPFPPKPAAMHAGTGTATGATATAANAVDKGTCNNSPNNIVDYDIPYEFTSDDFQKVRSQRMGFTWGGLVVPYKFYVSDRSFQSNTSAVAYVGYEGYFPGVNLAGIVALGPGAASTTQTQAATPPQTTPSTKSTTSVTYTAATGIVATFGGVMKLGAVVGWDWQGKSAGFKYEGKTWLALSIGAGF